MFVSLWFYLVLGSTKIIQILFGIMIFLSSINILKLKQCRLNDQFGRTTPESDFGSRIESKNGR